MHLLPFPLAGLMIALTLVGAAPASAKIPAADAPRAEDVSLNDKCLAVQKAANAANNSCVGDISETCMKAPGGDTTYGMMDCYKREIAVWDSKLNATYKALMKDASPKLKKTLKEAQRAWIADKGKTCLIPYAYFEAGTIAGPMGGACVNDFTARRFLLLDEYLHYAE